MMKGIELTNYTKHIRDYMTKTGVTAEEATSRFIMNLRVMRPHFDEFAPEIDFRTLGQQWNRMTSDIRLAQQSQVVAQLSKSFRQEGI